MTTVVDDSLKKEMKASVPLACTKLFFADWKDNAKFGLLRLGNIPCLRHFSTNLWMSLRWSVAIFSIRSSSTEVTLLITLQCNGIFHFSKEHSYACVFHDFVPENWDKLRHRISLTETDRHTASFFKISKTPVGGVVQARPQEKDPL